MYYLQKVTEHELIFIKDSEIEEEKRNSLNIKIGDNIKIEDHQGIFRSYLLRLYNVDPYITIMLENSGASMFPVAKPVQLEKL